MYSVIDGWPTDVDAHVVLRCWFEAFLGARASIVKKDIHGNQGINRPCIDVGGTRKRLAVPWLHRLQDVPVVCVDSNP